MAENEKVAENEKATQRQTHDTEPATTNVEDTRRRKSYLDVDEKNLSAAFENPLAGIPKEELMHNVDTFCRDNNLMDYVDTFRKGALVAQNPRATASMTELSDEDRIVLDREQTHRWSQPFTLYWLVIMCSLAAAVQGMDETVNNGAQALYLKQLNITTDRFSKSMVDSLTGLVVGARKSFDTIPLCGGIHLANTFVHSVSLLVLCRPGLLAHRADEQGIRPSWHDLH